MSVRAAKLDWGGGGRRRAAKSGVGADPGGTLAPVKSLSVPL